MGLVNRNEQVQQKALKEWYNDANQNMNQKNLELGIFIGKKLIPGTIALFVTIGT